MPNKKRKSNPPSFAWFRLFDEETGEDFQGTSADKVPVSASTDVADFRKAVKRDNPNNLSKVDASALKVYKNESTFRKGKEEALNPSHSLNDLGKSDSKDDALIVLVPKRNRNYRFCLPLSPSLFLNCTHNLFLSCSLSLFQPLNLSQFLLTVCLFFIHSHSTFDQPSFLLPLSLSTSHQPHLVSPSTHTHTLSLFTHRHSLHSLYLALSLFYTLNQTISDSF